MYCATADQEGRKSTVNAIANTHTNEYDNKETKRTVTAFHKDYDERYFYRHYVLILSFSLRLGHAGALDIRRDLRVRFILRNLHYMEEKKMTEIKTSKARILLKEVPENATDIAITGFSGRLTYTVPGQMPEYIAIRPPGSFSFLCLLRDITEGEAAQIVDSYWIDSPRESSGNRNLKVYNYYTFNQKTVCYTALESFASLLSANKVSSKNWAVLLEKLK